MTFVAVNKMFATNDGLFSIKDRLKITDIYEDLKKDLIGDRGIIRRRRFDYSQSAAKTPSQRQAVLKKMNELANLKLAIEQNWDTIKQRHMDSLEPYDITFDEEENLISEDENANKQDSMDSTKVDSYRKSNGAFKLLLATLPDYEWLPGALKATRKKSSIGGTTFEQSDKVYNQLMNKLHDSPGLDTMLERLKDMAADPTTGYHYGKLYTRLTKQVHNDATNTDVVNIAKMTPSTLMLLGGFWKVMKKQNPDVPIVFILQGGEIVIADTELSNSSKQTRSEMTQNIIASIREDVSKRSTLYRVDEEGLHNPTDALKKVKLDSKKLNQYVRFLGAFGINFKLKDINKLTSDQKRTFRKATEGLLEDLQTRVNVLYWSGNAINSTKNLLLLGSIRAVIENPIFESTYFSIAGERTQNFIGPNATSDLYHALKGVRNKKDLATSRYSYLLNDVFVKNSLVMQKLFNGNTRKRNTQDIFKTIYVGGTINEEANKRTRSSRLRFGERLMQEVNLNIVGVYSNLVPGDSELEWAIQMHTEISPFITKPQVGRGEHQQIFEGYFIDEINLARDKRIVAWGRDKQDLRFFKDILDDYDKKLFRDKYGREMTDKEFKKANTVHKQIKESVKLAKKKMSPEKIYADNKTAIRAAVESFIVQDSKDTAQLLQDYNIITKHADGYTHRLAIKEDKLSPTQMAAIIKTLTVNYMVANIEQHKMLYSDPYQYADELKRIKNFNSPRQSLIHGTKKLYKAFHNIYNKGYEKGDLGYANMDRDHFRTITLRDVWSTMGKELASQYPGYTDAANKEGWEETDGAGVISFQAYRFYRLLAGDWLPNNEAQYRYDIGYQERVMAINKATGTAKSRLNAEFKKYKKTRRKHDQSTYTAVKPIVSGNKANVRNFNDIVLDKYALFPSVRGLARGTGPPHRTSFDERSPHPPCRTRHVLGL